MFLIVYIIVDNVIIIIAYRKSKRYKFCISTSILILENVNGQCATKRFIYCNVDVFYNFLIVKYFCLYYGINLFTFGKYYFFTVFLTYIGNTSKVLTVIQRRKDVSTNNSVISQDLIFFCLFIHNWMCLNDKFLIIILVFIKK